LKIRWSAPALADRLSIIDYIASESARAAAAVDDRVSSAVNRLCDFPRSGRTGRVAGTRELVIVQTPYLVIYQIDDNVISILRVLHGAQRWPDGLPES